MHMYYMCAQYPQKSEDGIKTLVARVTDTFFLFGWFLFFQDKVSLELQILLSHQVGSGSRTWILGHSIAL